MAKLRKPFFLSVAMAGVSIRREMRTLIDQTESAVSKAIEEINNCRSLGFVEYDEESEDGHPYKERIYSYNGISGHNEDDVRSEYSTLIAQLFRRSAYLTIFGLFEHHLEACCKQMISIARIGLTFEDMENGTIEKTHEILASVITKGESKRICNISHLLKIRNVMAHDNALLKQEKKSIIERALRRICNERGGVIVLKYNVVHLDDGFLAYVIDEFERYHSQMESAIQEYYLRRSVQS